MKCNKGDQEMKAMWSKNEDMKNDTEHIKQYGHVNNSKRETHKENLCISLQRIQTNHKNKKRTNTNVPPLTGSTGR